MIFKIKKQTLIPMLFIIFIFGASLFSSKIYWRHPFAIYGSLAFDDQNLLVWDWAAASGYKPFTDIFYPYGLLTYYRNVTQLSRLFYISFSPLYVSLFFIILLKTVKRKWLSYASIIMFIVFVHERIGAPTFIRYGPLLILPMIAAFILTRTKRKSLGLFYLGIIVGLFFSAITDQGVYGGFVCGTLILVHAILQTIEKKASLGTFVKLFTVNIVRFIMGFTIGVLPLLAYLLAIDGIKGFFHDFSYIKDLTIFAKTPFIPWSKSVSNIFTFQALFASINLVTYRLLFNKKKISFFTLLYAGIILSIITLEQKNIIRSNDWQITLLSFPLMLLFAVEMAGRSFGGILIAISVCGFAVFGAKQLPPTFFYVNSQVRRANVGNDLKITFINEEADELAVLTRWITKHKKPNEFIFSLPGDPVLYQLLGQKPPYFLDLYEASPSYAQEGWISYIEKNNISLVFVNPIHAIQDDVPDYVRGSVIYPFLLTHFRPVDTVGKYLVFQRSNESDHFDIFGTKDPRFKSFISWLDNPSLASIPRSQGLYKKSEIKKYTVDTFTSVRAFNERLADVELSTQNMALAITMRGNHTATLLLTTQDGHTTTLTFDACQEKVSCVINLSRLPYFYIPRNLRAIELVGSKLLSISLLHLPNHSSFW